MLKSVSSITNALGALNYKGTWNASTNTPPLASGVGTKGDYYVVSVAGTTTLDGISSWNVGDWAVFNGTAWQRLEGGVDDPAPSLKSNSTTGLMQITGPAAGQTRVVTIPDANATMARTDAAQTFSGNQVFGGTGALTIPVGTSGQRPVGTAGMVRMNSTTKQPEWYDSDNAVWVPFAQPSNSVYQVEYLVVAGGGGGGGGGGNGGGGGGGAGGFRTDPNYIVTPGVAYTVTVGGGGAAGTGNLSGGTKGTNSVFGDITSQGGGGGGSGFVLAISGGSGGGSGTTQSPAVTGLGTSGQGRNGGAGFNGGNYASGGGGGAGAVGADATITTAGAGGNGMPSDITGASVTYAGGGGGAATNSSNNGAGGTGGGGAGGTAATPTGVAGTVNTGGGGGGAYGSGTPSAGSAGGSGVVVIAYAGAQRATGGTITSVGGYTIHTFTTSGTFTA